MGKPNYDENILTELIDKPRFIEFDPKWRFFWPYNKESIYDVVPCVPYDFPNFYEVLNKWAN